MIKTDTQLKLSDVTPFIWPISVCLIHFVISFGCTPCCRSQLYVELELSVCMLGTFIARLKILSCGGAGYVNVESSNLSSLLF
jgi:hypothetical protein